MTLRIWLTDVNIQVHLANQDVNPAGDCLQHIIRNPVHNDVTVPWYVFLPEWKDRVKYPCVLFWTTHNSQLIILRIQDFLLTMSKSCLKKHLPADSINKQAFMIPPQEPLAEINHTLLPKRKTKPSEWTTKLSSSRIDDFDFHLTLN